VYDEQEMCCEPEFVFTVVVFCSRIMCTVYVCVMCSCLVILCVCERERERERENYLFNYVDSSACCVSSWSSSVLHVIMPMHVLCMLPVCNL